MKVPSFVLATAVLVACDNTIQRPATGPVSPPRLLAALSVPGDFPTIQAAHDAASAGDTILVEPGTYVGQIIITKAITLASRYLTTRDEGYIASTILDGGGGAFAIQIPSGAQAGATIQGVTIRNAVDGITARAHFNLLNCLVRETSDGVDYESGSGGLVQFCTFEHNGDDGLDFDNAVAIVAADNVIRNNNDDGIEIRMQPHSGATLNISIVRNEIYGNGEDGIQLIHYDVLTNRFLEIAHNYIYDNADAGIGMMDGSISIEDFRAANIPEIIHIFNNTFSNNSHGVTGGDNTVVLNNIFVNHPVIAVKNVDANSALAFNLFFNNGTDNSGSNVDAGSSVFADPLLTEALALPPESPAIDAGTARYVWQGTTVLDLPRSAYFGAAPDVGAFENPTAASDTLDIRVAAATDDAEERASGSVATGSSDLELVFDGGDQTVGIRFTGVTIPAGAAIVNAYVQFTVDEATSEATALTVTGEASDDAATFGGSGNISGRRRTASAVAWAPVPWTAAGNAGPDQRTPNLAAVIQEIVNRPGWASGNALAIIVTGTGRRVAESYNGVAAAAPLLHVEYGQGSAGGGGGGGGGGSNIAPTARFTASCAGLSCSFTDTSTDPDGTVTAWHWTFGDGTSSTTRHPTHSYPAGGSYTVTLTATDNQGASAATSQGVSVSSSSQSPTTVEVRVAAASDDAEERASGSVTTGSSDLELVFDGSDQTVGMRFTGVPIPAGASITNAYVQFTVDQASSEATALTIAGEATDDAATFGGSGNISGRSRTTSTASWAPVPWTAAGDAGPEQRTPNLAAVIQEIVNRSGWASGNALAIIVTGTGRRVAESYNGVAAAAPLLHVEYGQGGGGGGSNTAPTARFTASCAGLTCSFTDTSTDPDGTVTAWHWTFGDGTSSTTRHPTHSYPAGGSYTVTLTATDNQGASAATSQGVSVNGSTQTPLTLEVRVAAATDDAEERASGSVTTGSSDLELVFDGSDQTVGMRFTGVPIPAGASITNAYVQFTVDQASSEATALTIAGEATDDAATFGGSGNISGRSRTASTVSWAPVPWTAAGDAGPDQRTPNLAAVIQEIVNRSGWASGNALAIIVTGTGRRVAESYNGVPAAAPLLRVEYLAGSN